MAFWVTSDSTMSHGISKGTISCLNEGHICVRNKAMIRLSICGRIIVTQHAMLLGLWIRRQDSYVGKNRRLDGIALSNPFTRTNLFCWSTTNITLRYHDDVNVKLLSSWKELLNIKSQWINCFVLLDFGLSINKIIEKHYHDHLNANRIEYRFEEC